MSRRTCGSVRRHHWRVVRRPASSPTRLSALADGALRSHHEPSGAAALLSAAASTILEARAEHRPGVRQLENVARAASQLSHELAPPARRPRAPARKQRGVAELCCAHLSDVQVRVVVVGGGCHAASWHGREPPPRRCRTSTVLPRRPRWPSPRARHMPFGSPSTTSERRRARSVAFGEPWGIRLD